MNTIEIQQGTYFLDPIALLTDTGAVSTAFDGWSAQFTMKNINDNTANDDLALIDKTFIVASGYIPFELSITETAIPLGKYKCDFRLQQTQANRRNTDTFYIKIIDKVTKE